MDLLLEICLFGANILTAVQQCVCVSVCEFILVNR